MKYTILCLTLCVLYLGAGAQMNYGTYGFQGAQPQPPPKKTPTVAPGAGTGAGAGTGNGFGTGAGAGAGTGNGFGTGTGFGAGTATATGPGTGTRTGAITPVCDPANCVNHGELGTFSKRTQCMDQTAPLPQSPTVIGTKFSLYKRGNRGIQLITNKMPATALFAAGFDARRQTVVAIHGWTQSAVAFDGLKNVLLKKADYNVILVDWEKGAGITGRWPLAYTQPVQNTRVVGKQLAMLLSHISAETGVNMASFHLIGASLGAQAAGYAGMYLNGTVGRISGLDPAKPNFEGQPADCKLESTDAQFVDVIHTNMDVAGVAESIGHVDFFPNGGRTQPGCPSPICSHLRAKSYFRASVWTDCQFHTTRCDGTPCGTKGCPPMGVNAFNPNDPTKKGEFCIETTGRPPYCMDMKENKPNYPGKVNPVVPGFNPGSNKPGRGGKPGVGAGGDRTIWFNHGKPLNPGTGWNPGAGAGGAARGPARTQGQTHHYEKMQKVETDSGAGHQMSINVGLTICVAFVLARLL